MSETSTVMHAMRLFAVGALLCWAAACGPRDAVPAPTAHPANPNAPTGEAAGPNPANGAAPAGPGAAELAAYQRARPVFQKYCASCHTPGSPKARSEAIEHFAMSGYPFGGHHAPVIGREVREVLGQTGEKPTMPKDRPGAVQGDELKLMLAWADAFDAAHPHAQGDDDDDHGPNDDHDHDHPGQQDDDDGDDD